MTDEQLDKIPADKFLKMMENQKGLIQILVGDQQREENKTEREEAKTNFVNVFYQEPEHQITFEDMSQHEEVEITQDQDPNTTMMNFNQSQHELIQPTAPVETVEITESQKTPFVKFKGRKNGLQLDLSNIYKKSPSKVTKKTESLQISKSKIDKK